MLLSAHCISTCYQDTDLHAKLLCYEILMHRGKLTNRHCMPPPCTTKQGTSEVCFWEWSILTHGWHWRYESSFELKQLWQFGNEVTDSSRSLWERERERRALPHSEERCMKVKERETVWHYGKVCRNIFSCSGLNETSFGSRWNCITLYKKYRKGHWEWCLFRHVVTR